jgi:OPT family oligopeptide transporter
MLLDRLSRQEDAMSTSAEVPPPNDPGSASPQGEPPAGPYSSPPEGVPKGSHAHAHEGAGAGAGGLKHLTDEQVRTWTLEQKDRWWLANVYRGDMPQLTLRSAFTGMLLGGVLSLTNLYVGVKTGWTLGVGITSVILAFAVFKVAQSLSLTKREFSLLENNCMQSIATSAGYMTAPLVSSLAAYMVFTHSVIPLVVSVIWMISLSVLGVLFAFPLKRRFINDEQLPFPEGRAAGVVLEALHSGDASEGIFKAKLLATTAGIAGLLKVFQSEKLMEKLHLAWLHVPEFLDERVYKSGGWWARHVGVPKILGTPLNVLTVRPDTDFVLMAAGGLMGIRTGVSILVGALVNYLVLVPWMIHRGDIHMSVVRGVAAYRFKDITMWALWGGVAMMTTSSLFAFFSKPQVLLSAFKGLAKPRDGAHYRDGGAPADDTAERMKGIELPMSVFAIGIPVVGAFVVFLARYFFHVSIWMGMLAIPLVFVFTLIAVNATGLTSITPSGALGKLTQLTFGALAPGNVTTNLMTAGITGEVAGNASNLLMDIKPGYMLGGKPRHQAIGHVLGIFAGAMVAVPVFYFAFLRGNPDGMRTESQPFPGATIWLAVAQVLTTGLSNLSTSARYAALVGAILGIVLELAKLGSKGKFPLSAVGLGLAFVIPFNTCFAMFVGSVIFWAAKWVFRKPESLAHRVMVKNEEATCAGIIAGGALMGILVIILEVFVVKGGGH